MKKEYFNDLLNELDGDRELLVELAQELVDYFQDNFKKLQHYIENNEYQNLKETAHALKGAINNFNAVEATNYAYKLEVMGRTEQIYDANEVLLLLKSEMDAFKVAVENI
jgi:HPt (histidine-containing phosphotransfer) domain-containing protein